ncbi:unnamed protein product [Angiostrongylus costaricensis]|uniref:ZP domain-containing protein n=1 Tax=Angiostrongylus costaricensis TaxID=334426 RepID=A0A0R3Q2Q3_ANGCS|nr:unnamed protein product [Angiostrongylus costaricensis]
MDGASEYGTRDYTFGSCRGRHFVQFHFIALPASPLNFRHIFACEYLKKPSYAVGSIGPRGAMDGASEYGTRDYTFGSCRGRHFVQFHFIALPASPLNFRHIFACEYLKKPSYAVGSIGPRGALDNASEYGT